MRGNGTLSASWKEFTDLSTATLLRDLQPCKRQKGLELFIHAASEGHGGTANADGQRRLKQRLQLQGSRLSGFSCCCCIDGLLSPPMTQKACVNVSVDWWG